MAAAEKFNYIAKRKLATQLLRKFGQNVVLRHTKQTDLGDGSVSDVITELNCCAVFVDFTLQELSNTNIQTGDKKAYTEHLAIRPAIGDLLVQDSTEWRIKAVKPLSPAGIDVLYELQIGV